MRHPFVILLTIALCVLISAFGTSVAQTTNDMRVYESNIETTISSDGEVEDNIEIIEDGKVVPDTAGTDGMIEGEQSEIIVYGGWKPDPIKAVWMGAIIPGYGQIYNHSYWKLPIVYGAFMGCAYAITWNNGIYTDYKTAYRDIVTDPYYDPLDPSKSYVAILPKGYSIDNTGTGGSMGGKDRYASYLQSNMNSYRRFRDISIVATVLVYALTLVDAYVDAQLYDFDISTDLSLNIQPVRTTDILNNRSTDLKLAIRF